MKRNSRDIPFACPMEATLGLIGGKWKTLILDNLTDGTLRFGELQKCMPKITPKMLTQQLRELEQDGLVFRRVFPVVPPKVEYELTEFGQTVRPILMEMRHFGRVYLDGEEHSSGTSNTQ